MIYEHDEAITAQWSDKNSAPISKYSKTSHVKGWWVCPKGHEWQTSVRVRYDGCGCPYCSGRLAVKGVNDLATLFPDVAAEWHDEKNGEKVPSDFKRGSHYRAWWRCRTCGHEWQALICKRTSGKGCPVCGHFAPGATHNLKVDYPDVAAEWDYEKNTNGPEAFLPSSDKRAWWKCKKCSQEWSCAIKTRTRKNRPTGCPFCAGKRPIIGKTDLATTHPDIASQWSSKNRKKPEDVTAGYNGRIWWQCNCGHEWQATVTNRVIGHQCPACRRKRRGMVGTGKVLL